VRLDKKEEGRGTLIAPKTGIPFGHLLSKSSSSVVTIRLRSAQPTTFTFLQMLPSCVATIKKASDLMLLLINRRLVRVALVAIVLGCGSNQELVAQEPYRGEQPRTPKREAQTLTFEMRAKPWAAVFEWLADKTGTVVITKDLPSGTFNFIAKQGQQFTISQIIDIINHGLLAHKYVLINRGASFTIVPADEEIDPSLVPRIPLGELDRHGKTEIVSTILKLRNLSAVETAPEVKKQMGPFGRVVTLAKLNQLILQDTVGNLEMIIETIRSFEDDWPISFEVIPLTVLDAVRVVDTLKAVFPGFKDLAPYIESDPTRNAIIVKGRAEQVADVKAAIRAIGENADANTNARFFTLHGSGTTVAEALQRLFSQIRPENPVQVLVPSKVISPAPTP
jgi:type II secretory pathway component GspD/PulD (secretin)